MNQSSASRAREDALESVRQASALDRLREQLSQSPHQELLPLPPVHQINLDNQPPPPPPPPPLDMSPRAPPSQQTQQPQPSQVRSGTLGGGL